MLSREERKYPNGMKHIHLHVPFLKSVSLNFLVNAGSSSELRSEQWGAAHFLEHMLFNGSEKYPDTEISTALVEEMGAYENAWTSTDFTTYRLIVTPDQFDKAFDLLFHRVYKPLLRQEDVDKERGIIQEERVMYENRPVPSLENAATNKLYEGSPYGHNIIGTKESLDGMSSEILKEFHQQYYSPRNSVFVTYGGMKIDEIGDHVGEMLASLQEYDVTQPDIRFEAFDNESELFELQKDTESAYYILASFTEKPESVEDLASLILFWNSLSQGVGSIFNQELRVKDSLTAGIRDYSQFTKAASVLIYIFEVDPSKREALREKVNELINRYEELFTDEQFERVSGLSYGNFLRTLEVVDHPSTLAYENMSIFNLAFGTDYTYEEMEKALRSRTKEDVINMAKRLYPGTRKVEGLLLPKN